jgi:hypothetical protein
VYSLDCSLSNAQQYWSYTSYSTPNFVNINYSGDLKYIESSGHSNFSNEIYQLTVTSCTPVTPSPTPNPTPSPTPNPTPNPTPSPTNAPVYYYNATRCHDSVNQIVYGGTNYYGTGIVVISGGTTYCYTIQNEVGAQAYDDTVSGPPVGSCGDGACYVPPPPPTPNPTPSPTESPTPNPTPSPTEPPVPAPTPSPTPSPVACTLWEFYNSGPTDDYVYYDACGTAGGNTAYVYSYTAPQYCVIYGPTPYSFNNDIIITAVGSC